MEIDTQWLTRAEAAARAGRDVRTIDRWFKTGVLTRYRMGRAVRVSSDELDGIMSPQKEEETPR